MAKQIKRLREQFTKELVSLDSIVVRLVDVKQGNKTIKMPAASISGSNLEAQVDFGEKVIIETTTKEGKNVYYRLRPTLASGIQLPKEEGFYSLENTDIWVDTQEGNEDKHILRFSEGTFVLTGKFKEKEDLPF